MAKYADITPFYEWLDSIMKEDKKSHPDHNTLMFYEIIDELDSLPEIVRCNKCLYWDKAKSNKKGFLICPASGMEITADDFCSYGERKNDG